MWNLHTKQLVLWTHFCVHKRHYGQEGASPHTDERRAAQAALPHAHLAPDLPPDVDRAERLARNGARLAAGPYGRDGLIQDLAAASLLVRYLEDDRVRVRAEGRNRTADEKREASRAYYWLATVEARSLDGFWVNLSERHFEAAIRTHISQSAPWGRSVRKPPTRS